MAEVAIEFVNETMLARALCMSLSSVRRWRSTWNANGGKFGIGPRPYRFGKSVRYRISECEEWAEQHRAGVSLSAEDAPVASGRL
jgi:predicted DNA-binding transcriptional regulator AlpA